MSSIQRVDGHDWHEFAACSGEMSTVFYPPMRSEDRRTKRLRESRAKAVCATCPVRTECLDHAVTNDERYGIWGGLTDRERRTALRSISS